MKDLFEEYNDVELEELYSCLYAFTDKLIRKKNFFMTYDNRSFIKGKEIHDYVADSIERVLLEPEKYDPNKSSLLDYIKYHIIRSLVGNDIKSKEFEKKSDNLNYIPIESDYQDETEDSFQSEYISSFFNERFDEKIDFESINNYIYSEIQGDEDLECVYTGIISGYKRREIINEFNMDEKRFDNARRRLDTILKNTSKKFKISN